MSVPLKWRKKPVAILAMRYEGGRESAEAVCAWIASHGGSPAAGGLPSATFVEATGEIEILTLEGLMKASPGDHVIRGVWGEFYPCKPDVFNATYERDYTDD